MNDITPTQLRDTLQERCPLPEWKVVRESKMLLLGSDIRNPDFAIRAELWLRDVEVPLVCTCHMPAELVGDTEFDHVEYIIMQTTCSLAEALMGKGPAEQKGAGE